MDQSCKLQIQLLAVGAFSPSERGNSHEKDIASQDYTTHYQAKFVRPAPKGGYTSRMLRAIALWGEKSIDQHRDKRKIEGSADLSQSSNMRQLQPQQRLVDSTV